MATEITPRELAKQIENGQPIRLIDVRQLWENQVARLPASLLIPLNELPMRAAEIPAEPATWIVVYFHHSVRSLSAAEYLRRVGHVLVRSLAGGIDAWSCEVDPNVPRYLGYLAFPVLRPRGIMRTPNGNSDHFNTLEFANRSTLSDRKSPPRFKLP